jgi:cardiolipin synthase (CMP-forming)
VIRHLPNLLSLVRLVVTPPLLIAAIWAGSRSWFFGLLCVAWLTDALDGFIARRFQVESERGRMLDSWGDYVTAAVGVVGVARLWPEIMAREWPWFATAVISCFGVVIYGLVRYGRPPGFHTWMAKAVAVVMPFALACLLAGWTGLPWHAAVVLQVLAALEEAAICHLLPGYSGTMSSAWHAWRRRKSPPAAAAPGRPSVS